MSSFNKVKQMDGSHYACLENRSPKFVLMGYVDDATGRFYGRFYDHEGVPGKVLDIHINTALTRRPGKPIGRNC